MILHALTDYYDRLEKDPEQDVASFGFARAKISYCLVLQADGSVAGFQDIREEVERGGRNKTIKRVGRRLVVPDRGIRSGKLIKPNFLWDNTGYVFGVDGKGKPERSREAFEAFRDLHRMMLDRCDDPCLKTLCVFLDCWDSSRVTDFEHWEDAIDANVVFRLAGETAYLHESAELRDAWLAFATNEYEVQEGVSLISGEADRLARLHPMIRGVAGAQSSGASIVSFNHDAFESYGRSQSYNAPVGLHDAFRYTTALNRLVNDPCRCMRLAGDTVVFWTARPTAFESEFFGVLQEQATASEDEPTLARQRKFLRSLQAAWLRDDPMEDAEVAFHFLALSPNASRLSVRFWLSGTVQDFAKRIGRHMADLEIGGLSDGLGSSLRRIVLETARPKNGWPEEESVSPLLAGAVLRSVLGGTPYPAALLSGTLKRIRAEGFADADLRRDWRDAMHRRAAILKAYLIRNFGKEISVSLIKDYPNPAYQLGRLFAALEKTQEDALGRDLNVTIKDRFFGSASANPVAAFPRLLRLHAHHLDKLSAPEKRGLKVVREKLVQEICEHVSAKTGFPAHLALDEQGLFFIGYYHQRQDFFTSKDTSGNDTNTSNGAEGARRE